MKVKLIKPVWANTNELPEGLTLNVEKKYKLLGCAGGCVCLKDDKNEQCIIFESYLDVFKLFKIF